jgi:5-methylcytosine-specific restriction endonuclease McrA
MNAEQRAEESGAYYENCEVYMYWLLSHKPTVACFYCGSEIPPESVTFDHLYPISWGGAHVEHNIGTACRRCNSEKYTSHPFNRPGTFWIGER